MPFLVFFDGFHVLISKLKNKIWKKKTILMHFQAKNTLYHNKKTHTKLTAIIPATSNYSPPHQNLYITILRLCMWCVGMHVCVRQRQCRSQVGLKLPRKGRKFAN